MEHAGEVGLEEPDWKTSNQESYVLKASGRFEVGLLQQMFFIKNIKFLHFVLLSDDELNVKTMLKISVYIVCRWFENVLNIRF